MRYQPFIWMNFLYKKASFVYKPLYYFYKRISDRDKIHMIRESVTKGMTVIDIGANIGFYSNLLSRLVGPYGKVIAYEPEERNLYLLKKSTKKRNNIDVRPVACSERTGILNLYLSKDMNIDHQTFDSGEGRPIRRVRCVAVDDDLDEDQNVGFIKIDIQGYDYYALLGMKKTIQRSQKITLIGEFWPYGLKKAGVEPAAYIRLLEKFGFTIRFFREENDPFNMDRVKDKYYYTDFYAFKN